MTLHGLVSGDVFEICVWRRRPGDKRWLYPGYSGDTATNGILNTCPIAGDKSFTVPEATTTKIPVTADDFDGNPVTRESHSDLFGRAEPGPGKSMYYLPATSLTDCGGPSGWPQR